MLDIGLMSVLLKRLSMFLPNVLWVYSFIKEVHFFKSACYVVVLRSLVQLTLFSVSFISFYSLLSLPKKLYREDPPSSS